MGFQNINKLCNKLWLFFARHINLDNACGLRFEERLKVLAKMEIWIRLILRPFLPWAWGGIYCFFYSALLEEDTKKERRRQEENPLPGSETWSPKQIHRIKVSATNKPSWWSVMLSPSYSSYLLNKYYQVQILRVLYVGTCMAWRLFRKAVKFLKPCHRESAGMFRRPSGASAVHTHVKKNLQ